MFDINTILALLLAQKGGNGSGGGNASIATDKSLTQSGMAADAAAVGQKLAEQSEAIANLQISGLTTAQVNALDGMFKIASYTKDPTAEYTAFKVAFGLDGGEVEPDEPENGVVQSGSVLIITSGVTVTQTDNVLRVA